MRPILKALLKGRFSLMLITLITMFLVGPLVGRSQGMIDEVFGWFIIAVLISCIRAISTSRNHLIFMIVLTVINVLLGTSEIIIENESVRFVSAVLLFKIVYFVLVFVSIMRFVLDEKPVTGDKIYGAISAYLLMGIIWAFIYTLFFINNANSFNVPAEWLNTDTANRYWSFYFSFTTLTTLGYGDITPQTTATQSYAVMQAAIGQVFLAVIVARLIALQIIHKHEER